MPLVNRTFDQLIDFTRTSAATFVNSSGNIASTPQSRNLLTFTQEFDNAAWTKVSLTITANSTAAPDGTMTADTLLASAVASTNVTLLQTATVSGATTFSFYVKAGTHNFIQLINAGDVQAFANFNVATGAVGTTGSKTTATITSVGNGWYRCAATFSAATTYTTSFRLYMIPSATSAYAATWSPAGTETIFLWGAQLEQASAATDYTRNFGGLFPPRFDYDPVTLAPRGLLLEEQRTNLLVRSEEFDNASWTKSNATVTANATTSPDGTVDADKLVEDATSNAHNVRQNATISSATSYTFSVYAKAAERSQIQIQYFDGTTNRFPVFSLIDGTKVTDNGIGSSWTSTSVGNGWWRFTITVTSAGTTAQCYVYPASGGTVSYTGDGTSGIFIWGAQLEAGAFATSYIPTVASQVTRSADVAAINAPNFASWYNAAEGTMVLSASVLGSPGAATVSFAQLSNGSSNNFEISLGMFDFSAPSFQVVNSTTQANLDLGSMSASQIVNMAGAYKTNDFAGVLNGGTVQTDTSGSIPSGISTLGIGFRLGGVYMNGHIRSLRFYPVRLTNAQLQALTA